MGQSTLLLRLEEKYEGKCDDDDVGGEWEGISVEEEEGDCEEKGDVEERL